MSSVFKFDHERLYSVLSKSTRVVLGQSVGGVRLCKGLPESVLNKAVQAVMHSGCVRFPVMVGDRVYWSDNGGVSSGNVVEVRIVCVAASDGDDYGSSSFKVRTDSGDLKEFALSKLNDGTFVVKN